MYFFSLSENSRVLSEWEQWTYCKGSAIVDYNISAKLNVILSRKPDHKLLPFLVCTQGIIKNYTFVENLSYLFNQFTSDEKQDIAVIRSQINTFYSVIMRYINTYYLLDELLLYLPKIKPV